MNIDEQMLIVCVSCAEQQLLAEIPEETSLNHHFSGHFRRKMRALCRYERRSPRMRQIVRYAKTTVAASVVIVVILMSVFMNVEAARKEFFKVITKVYERFTEIRIYESENATPVLTFYRPGYVPKGYELEKQENYNSICYDVYYVSKTGNTINYSQHTFGGTYIFDTEDAYTDVRIIDGIEVHLTEKNGLSQVYWNDDSFFYTLDGKIELQELVKMAESVIIN